MSMPSQSPRSRRVRRAAATVLATAVLPLAIATSAHASTSRDGCTVTPRTPYATGTLDSFGRKLIRYEFTVSCSAGRSITINQERREEDTFSDDSTGLVNWSQSFSSAATRTLGVTRALPDTEWGDEEIYQRLRFRVSSNGVSGSTTAWENSGVRTFSN